MFIDTGSKWKKKEDFARNIRLQKLSRVGRRYWNFLKRPTRKHAAAHTIPDCILRILHGDLKFHSYILAEWWKNSIPKILLREKEYVKPPHAESVTGVPYPELALQNQGFLKLTKGQLPSLLSLMFRCSRSLFFSNWKKWMWRMCVSNKTAPLLHGKNVNDSLARTFPRTSHLFEGLSLVASTIPRFNTLRLFLMEIS